MRHVSDRKWNCILLITFWSESGRVEVCGQSFIIRFQYKQSNTTVDVTVTIN